MLYVTLCIFYLYIFYFCADAIVLLIWGGGEVMYYSRGLFQTKQPSDTASQPDIYCINVTYKSYSGLNVNVVTY